MNILLGNLFIVYIGSIYARVNPKNNTLEENYRKYNYLFILIILTSLICVSGFRYNSGTDYHTYIDIYKNTPSFKPGEEGLEVGFIILNKILFNITENPQIMFIITSIIINTLIVYGAIKYSTKFELSMFLYITTFSYYSTFNGIRQWIASAIIFAGLKYLMEQNLKKYFLFIFIAYFFHSSVLIMIPMYFIVNGKFFSKRTLVIIGLFIFSYVFYNGFLEQVFNLLQGTKYEYYGDIMRSWQEGASMIRLIVYVVPILLMTILYKSIDESRSKNVDILMNLCLMSVLFMLLGTKHVFFIRMNLYFDIYYILLIPILTQTVNKKQNRLIYYLILISYFAFSYKLLVWGDANIVPYQMNINLF
jgi:transmembrane protein EpsG